jgi:hypothetical protein
MHGHAHAWCVRTLHVASLALASKACHDNPRYCALLGSHTCTHTRTRMHARQAWGQPLRVELPPRHQQCNKEENDNGKGKGQEACMLFRLLNARERDRSRRVGSAGGGGEGH